MADQDMTASDPLVRRAEAAQATKDLWETRRFKLGENDCAYMLAWHLRRLGYSVRMPPSGSYRSPRGAERALAERDCTSTAEWIASLGLEPIAPAAAIVGDVLLLPAGHTLGAIAICMGNGRALAYHDDVRAGATVLQPLEFIGAWRAAPVETGAA